MPTVSTSSSVDGSSSQGGTSNCSRGWGSTMRCGGSRWVSAVLSRLRLPGCRQRLHRFLPSSAWAGKTRKNWKTRKTSELRTQQRKEKEIHPSWISRHRVFFLVFPASDTACAHEASEDVSHQTLN